MTTLKLFNNCSFGFFSCLKPCLFDIHLIIMSLSTSLDRWLFSVVIIDLKRRSPFYSFIYHQKTNDINGDNNKIQNGIELTNPRPVFLLLPVADCESESYPEIDGNSVYSSAAASEGDAAVDSGFSSSQVAVAGGGRPASEADSWESGEFESFSSDGDDDDATTDKTTSSG